MGEDGSVKIKIRADDREAQKALDQLNKSIEKTASALDKTSAKHNGIVEALNEAKSRASEAAAEIQKTKDTISKGESLISDAGRPGGVTSDDYNRVSAVIAEQKEKLAEQEKIYQSIQKEVASLEKQEQKIAPVIAEQTEKLRQQKAAAGDIEKIMAKQSSGSTTQLKAAMDSANASINRGFKSLLRWGFGIRSTFVLIRRLKSYIREAVAAFAEQDEETKNNITSLKSALQGLKLSWGAAFAPIFNAIVPILQKLIAWLTSAANAVARFFAVLGGKTSYKKAIAGNEALADSYGGAGAAAKDAEKQIMGFDEINKLSDSSSSGGGGGGGGASASDLVEEAIDSDSLAARLAIAAKDVLFKWDDLTYEDIAAKAIAGLAGLGGMIVGGTIGGIPGAIIGLAAGLAFGILMDSTIFNFDGTLSQDELLNALKLALGGIGGAIIGLTIGGPVGAAIGLLLGLSIAFAGITIDFEPVRLKIDEWATSVKNYFQTYIDKWKARGSDQANGVGFYIVMGILEGLIRGVIDLGKKIYDSVIKPIIDFFKNGFEINSPSKVMAEIGGYMIEGLWNGIEEKWNAFRSWLSSSWNALRSWWSGLSLGSFPFRLPHIQVDWQMLSADSILARFLGFTAIPHLSVAWYARGGIVDGATLIGAGEQGKEAIIPLERNTGWIKQVAQELLSSMESKYKGALVGMPAMAMGTVAPPRAISGGGTYGITEEDVASIIRGVMNAFSSAPMHFDVENRIYLDGRQIASNITRHQRELQRAAGE